MRTIKIYSRDVIHDSRFSREGFLFATYQIGLKVEGRVRHVDGSRSEPQKHSVRVPLIIASPERQAEVERDWGDGIKFMVVDGLFEGYCGWFELREVP